LTPRDLCPLSLARVDSVKQVSVTWILKLASSPRKLETSDVFSLCTDPMVDCDGHAALGNKHRVDPTDVLSCVVDAYGRTPPRETSAACWYGW